jgi:hypothetical protein
VAQITVIAKWLLDLQAEVQCQDEEFDTLVNAVKEQQTAVQWRLDKESNQVRLVMDSLDESRVALRAQMGHCEPWGSKGANVPPTGATQWEALGPEIVPAEHEDADGWHCRNHREGSHIQGEPGLGASSPCKIPGPEQCPKPCYPQLGLQELTGCMGLFSWLGPPQREWKNTSLLSSS